MTVNTGKARTGGCLCGDIRYEVTGAEDFPHTCSCEHCQKLSGGPMMSWVSFPVAGFTWIGPGGEASWHYTWPDSKRGFCPRCGSQVCAIDDGSDSICMTMSSLDDPREFTPVKQSFAENSVHWLPVAPWSAS
jgi:hypothetical protein